MDKIDLENYKGIIFDLDGVIYDITEAIQQAIDDSIIKYEIKVNREEIMQEIAHLIEEIQNYPVPQIILKSYDLLQIDSFKGLNYFKKMRIAIFIFNQFNKYRENAGMSEGIDNIISKLSKKKKLAILTNNKSTYAEEILNKFKLRKYFDLIIGFNDVSEVKPSPEGIQLIIKKWNINPLEAIFIGDMTTDIIAGKAASVKTISITSGLATKESLMNQNPDFHVNNTLELKNLFNL